jgi:Tfp pilus assembly protein PilN
MIRVNLYPAIDVVEHTPPQLYGVVVFAVCAAGLGYWYLDLSSERSALVEQTATLQQEVQQLEQVTAEVTKFEQRKADLVARLAVIAQLEANQRGPVELMNNVIAGIPENPRGLWLTSLSQTETSVSMEGRAFDVTFIADFISALERSPSLRNVELEYWDQDTESTIRFRLNCELEELS